MVTGMQVSPHHPDEVSRTARVRSRAGPGTAV